MPLEGHIVRLFHNLFQPPRSPVFPACHGEQPFSTNGDVAISGWRNRTSPLPVLRRWIASPSLCRDRGTAAMIVVIHVRSPDPNSLNPPFGKGSSRNRGPPPNFREEPLLNSCCHSRGACPRESGERESRTAAHRSVTRAKRSLFAICKHSQTPGLNDLVPRYCRAKRRLLRNSR